MQQNSDIRIVDLQSNGFTDLHSKLYKGILSVNGCRINEVMYTIEIVHEIRHLEPQGMKGWYIYLSRKS